MNDTHMLNLINNVGSYLAELNAHYAAMTEETDAEALNEHYEAISDILTSGREFMNTLDRYVKAQESTSAYYKDAYRDLVRRRKIDGKIADEDPYTVGILENFRKVTEIDSIVNLIKNYRTSLAEMTDIWTKERSLTSLENLIAKNNEQFDEINAEREKYGYVAIEISDNELGKKVYVRSEGKKVAVTIPEEKFNGETTAKVVEGAVVTAAEKTDDIISIKIPNGEVVTGRKSEIADLIIARVKELNNKNKLNEQGLDEVLEAPTEEVTAPEATTVVEAEPIPTEEIPVETEPVVTPVVEAEPIVIPPIEPTKPAEETITEPESVEPIQVTEAVVEPVTEPVEAAPVTEPFVPNPEPIDATRTTPRRRRRITTDGVDELDRALDAEQEAAPIIDATPVSDNVERITSGVIDINPDELGGEEITAPVQEVHEEQSTVQEQPNEEKDKGKLKVTAARESKLKHNAPYVVTGVGAIGFALAGSSGLAAACAGFFACYGIANAIGKLAKGEDPFVPLEQWAVKHKIEKVVKEYEDLELVSDSEGLRIVDISSGEATAEEMEVLNKELRAALKDPEAKWDDLNSIYARKKLPIPNDTEKNFLYSIKEKIEDKIYGEEIPAPAIGGEIVEEATPVVESAPVVETQATPIVEAQTTPVVEQPKPNTAAQVAASKQKEGFGSKIKKLFGFGHKEEPVTMNYSEPVVATPVSTTNVIEVDETPDISPVNAVPERNTTFEQQIGQELNPGEQTYAEVFDSIVNEGPRNYDSNKFEFIRDALRISTSEQVVKGVLEKVGNKPMTEGDVNAFREYLESEPDIALAYVNYLAKNGLLVTNQIEESRGGMTR